MGGGPDRDAQQVAGKATQGPLLQRVGVGPKVADLAVQAGAVGVDAAGDDLGAQRGQLGAVGGHDREHLDLGRLAVALGQLGQGVGDRLRLGRRRWSRRRGGGRLGHRRGLGQGHRLFGQLVRGSGLGFDGGSDALGAAHGLVGGRCGLGGGRGVGFAAPGGLAGRLLGSLAHGLAGRLLGRLAHGLARGLRCSSLAHGLAGRLGLGLCGGGLGLRRGAGRFGRSLFRRLLRRSRLLGRLFRCSGGFGRCCCRGAGFLRRRFLGSGGSGFGGLALGLSSWLGSRLSRFGYRRGLAFLRRGRLARWSLLRWSLFRRRFGRRRLGRRCLGSGRLGSGRLGFGGLGRRLFGCRRLLRRSFLHRGCLLGRGFAGCCFGFRGGGLALLGRGGFGGGLGSRLLRSGGLAGLYRLGLGGLFRRSLGCRLLGCRRCAGGRALGLFGWTGGSGFSPCGINGSSCCFWGRCGRFADGNLGALVGFFC